jgi:hypothetical protein
MHKNQTWLIRNNTQLLPKVLTSQHCGNAIGSNAGQELGTRQKVGMPIAGHDPAAWSDDIWQKAHMKRG